MFFPKLYVRGSFGKFDIKNIFRATKSAHRFRSQILIHFVWLQKRSIDREIERDTEREREKEREKQTDRQTERQIDREKDIERGE